MSLKAIIFDLDQTLVNSSIALPYRNRRDWQKVYSLIPKFDKYAGIDDILDFITKSEILTCIVTNAPKPYCTRVINFFGWKFSGMVCYHDTSHHKPNPDPIIRALNILGIESHQAVSVGDQANDIVASHNAGVQSIAATWGTQEIESLIRSGPQFICDNPNEIKDIIMNQMEA